MELNKVDDKTAYDNLLVKYAELEKENADLKEECEAYAGLYLKSDEQLTKAEELLQRFIKWARTENCEKFDVILEQAEQFLKEGE